MSDLSEITKKIIEFRDARDWKKFHNPKDLALSLVLEASEVLEHFQWKSSEEVQKHIKEKKEELGEELADVLWYLLVLAHETDIDVKKALEKKLQKNQKRYAVEKVKGTHKKYTEI